LCRLGMHEGLFEYFAAAVRTFRRQLQDVVGDPRVGPGKPVEDGVEWKCRIRIAVFAGFDHLFGPAQQISVNEHNNLLFGCRVAELGHRCILHRGPVRRSHSIRGFAWFFYKLDCFAMSVLNHKSLAFNPLPTWQSDCPGVRERKRSDRNKGFNQGGKQ